jgi:hypothetical protein
MFQPRSSLASSLLLLSLGACALSACFLSQEDQILNIPPQRNRPPRIMEEQQPITPDSLAQGRIKRIAAVTDCQKLEFTFLAEDPDIDDRLMVRWYLDYPESPVIIEEQVLSTSGKPIRDDAAYLAIDLSTPTLPAPLNRLYDQGTHVIEALLFDGALGPTRKPIPIAPATDGGVENPSYVVSYAWVVEVSQTCPPP